MEDIIQQIESRLTALEDQTQNNFVAPWHIHNAIDAPNIPISNLAGANRKTATYNPASLATGVGATTTITVKNAILGDFVMVSFSLDLQGILLTAYVSAAGIVSVRFQNQTGGTIDLGSGTLSVIAIHNI